LLLVVGALPDVLSHFHGGKAGSQGGQPVAHAMCQPAPLHVAARKVVFLLWQQANNPVEC